MKLYKYRSLQNFQWIVDILRFKRFHMAKWNDLNDPMEGHYTYMVYNTQSNFRDLIDQYYMEKIRLKICSFSSTYKPILLWSHYANQHRGIAIEVEVNTQNHPNLHKVNYVPTIPELNFDQDPNPTPLQVLTHKVDIWSYEQEYRFIAEENSLQLNNITGIYFGIRVRNNPKQRIREIINGAIPTYETAINFDTNEVFATNNIE